MNWELIALLGAITYGSRALALVLLPSLPNDVRVVIDRVPAALFAGLAAHSLIVPGTGLADGPILAAATGALVVSPMRSLPICLIAGVLGYVALTVIA